MSEDKLPGVVFRVKDSELVGVATGKRKRVNVTLEAEVHDDAVWEAAFTRLQEGLKVYTVDDFKTEMLNALREEHMATEVENRRLKTELKNALEENKQMKAGLSVLHRQIEG